MTAISSGVGMLALFGVCVQTGVIMIEYINRLRSRGNSVVALATEGSVLHLRPIIMTMLVATLGLIPAAMSQGMGPDSQTPLAIDIRRGTDSGPYPQHFSLPTMYSWMASPGDVLPEPEPEFTK